MSDVNVRSETASRQCSIYPLDTQEGIELLPVADILYAEVYQHKTSFILRNGRRVQGVIPLSEVERKLKENGFFRCHRSYHVNYLAVSKIRANELRLVNNITVPISKYKYKEFLSAYSEYIGVDI